MKPGTKKESLKSVLLRLQGRKSFFRREAEALRILLRETDRDGRFSELLLKCALLAAAGLAAGLLIRNTAAAPLLSGLGFLIPIWNLKLYSIKYNRHISSQLESSLALITASFIRSSNLEAAIAENLPYFDPLLRLVFEDFLSEYKVNASIETCIRNMSRKINHKVFSQWCTGLIKVCQNSALKEELVQIVSKLSSIRIVQENLDTETSEILTQYIIMLVLLVCTVPLIYFVNYEWFMYFFTHPLGKVSVAFSVFAFTYGVHSIVKCSVPVRYDV
jgi:hypothetical protein